MHEDPFTPESAYTPSETAELLQISPIEVLELIKRRALGFIAGPSGIAIKTEHIADYLLGQTRRATPEYQSLTPKKKPRKRYARSRTRR